MGLLSRFTGLVLSINMFVAYWTADHEALTSIFSNPGKFYVAAPYTFSLRVPCSSDLWGRPLLNG